jgi:hypothetical protein
MDILHHLVGHYTARRSVFAGGVWPAFLAQYPFDTAGLFSGPDSRHLGDLAEIN